MLLTLQMNEELTENMDYPPEGMTRVEAMRPLEEGFEPGPHDVICGRGRAPKQHEGNLRYKRIIEANLPRYQQATCKLDKTMIVSWIVDAVRRASPYGGFVRKEGDRWYEVGDHIAREKTGQTYV